MGIKQMLTSLFSGGLAEIRQLVDEVTTSKEEKLRLQNEIDKIFYGLQSQLFEADLKRFQESHETFRKDGQMQKVYALTFLIAYVGLSVVMLLIITRMTNLQDYAISLISTIWGGMSVKVNTITDFFFGSSSGSQHKDDRILKK
ncbi:hypothetical protein OKW21_005027 [Catalinimonas alkaloidigena]|uniref:hypothetical protein n=1 Tax=Catalinimonas alkaloidigena TaxID=1075417 RepID=UPI0024059056|nr:hypothetical protein [Catalinimonas alkaloidigena]MDF9799764.1 hypothetical protein [Catalinimonas alkaloidigena]